jgi:hypothetical protein
MEVEMKTLVSALALLVGSNVMAVAADQTLKFKLVAFNVGEKDGEYHFVGATVSPNGTIGTKDRASPDPLNRIPRRLSGLLPGLVLCNFARGA